MMPNSGRRNVLKAAPTRAGLAIQTMSRARRGKAPPKSANRQPIFVTSCLVLYCPPSQGCRVQAADQAVLTDGGVAVHRDIPSIRLLALCMTPLEHEPKHDGGSSPRDAYPRGDFHQVFMVSGPAIGRRIRSRLAPPLPQRHR